MTSPRLTLTLSNQAPTDPWWVRVVQEDVADDSASLADAAVLIDTLYNLDPCDDGATTATEDPDSDTTDTVVETEIESVACLYDENGDVDVVLQVIRSAVQAEYKLALQGGELKSVETIRETITLILVVKDLSSLTLEYPVLGNFSATWRGAVYGSSGVIAPPIKRRGNTLDFGATVKAGTISATFTTEYDRCNVNVLGDNGQPGACTARVFYHGLVEELELELPEASEEIGSCQVRWTVPQDRDQIECYRTVYVSRRCQCSPDELESYSYEEVVSCPDSVIRCPGVLNECRHYLGTVVAHEYVECASDMVEAVSHPAYYKKMCCQEPSVTLPQCKEQKTSWRGGRPIKGGAQQYYDLYGKDLEIIPVGPPGGICGIWTKKQQILSNNCCDGVPPLIWDTSVSPEVVAPNNTVVIGVTGGGKYPYRWSVVGTGFWFQNGSKGVETDGPQVRLVATSGACGFAQITVTDGCTSSAGAIRCTAGTWEKLGSFIPAADFDYEANGFIRKLVNGYGHEETGMGELLGEYYLGNTPYAPGTETWSWHTWGAGGQWVCCFDASGMTMSDPIVGVFNNIPITRGSIALGPDRGAPCYPAQWYRPSWLNTSLSVYRWRC